MERPESVEALAALIPRLPHLRLRAGGSKPGLLSPRQSSVVRKTVPAKPLAIRSSTCRVVSSSIIGGPGIAIRTIATSSWPAGLTVSQRKSPISGRVTSERTSMPSFSV